MKDYKVNGNVIEITLESGKVVKCATKWVQDTMARLETDMEDVVLMWLEDNDYLVNEEQEELDKLAKVNKVKVKADTEKPTRKTPKERVAKPQPEKEFLISLLAKTLEIEDISNLNVENKAKLITFDYKGASYKLDLVQKRPPKTEK